jgi:hypothetical protein
MASLSHKFLDPSCELLPLPYKAFVLPYLNFILQLCDGSVFVNESVTTNLCYCRYPVVEEIVLIRDFCINLMFKCRVWFQTLCFDLGEKYIHAYAKLKKKLHDKQIRI